MFGGRGGGTVEGRDHFGGDEVGEVGSVKDRGRSQRLVETLGCRAGEWSGHNAQKVVATRNDLTSVDELRRLGREDLLRDPRFRVGLFSGQTGQSAPAYMSRRCRAHLVILHDSFEFDDTNESEDAQVFFDLLVRCAQEELQRQKRSVTSSSQRPHVTKTNLIQSERRSHCRVEPDRVAGALAKLFA